MCIRLMKISWNSSAVLWGLLAATPRQHNELRQIRRNKISLISFLGYLLDLMRHSEDCRM